MKDGVHVDLTALTVELKETDKKFAAAVRKNIRTAVTEGGTGIVEAVKEAASWSTRIPGATRMTVTFSTRSSSVNVRVDKNKAPHARPFEQGNANSFSAVEVSKQQAAHPRANRRLIQARMRRSGIGVGRALRHPVFKKGGWAVEPTRPFFFAAIEARTPEVDAKFQTAIDVIASEAGFKGA